MIVEKSGEEHTSLHNAGAKDTESPPFFVPCIFVDVYPCGKEQFHWLTLFSIMTVCPQAKSAGQIIMIFSNTAIMCDTGCAFVLFMNAVSLVRVGALFQ